MEQLIVNLELNEAAKRDKGEGMIIIRNMGHSRSAISSAETMMTTT